MDGDIEETVNLKLIQNGERDRLKDLLRDRLADCGWEKAMKAHCRAYAKDKVLNQVKLDGLINEITQKSGKSIPDNVKTELLEEIKASIIGVANSV